MAFGQVRWKSQFWLSYTNLTLLSTKLIIQAWPKASSHGMKFLASILASILTVITTVSDEKMILAKETRQLTMKLVTNSRKKVPVKKKRKRTQNRSKAAKRQLQLELLMKLNSYKPMEMMVIQQGKS